MLAYQMLNRDPISSTLENEKCMVDSFITNFDNGIVEFVRPILWYYNSILSTNFYFI